MNTSFRQASIVFLAVLAVLAGAYLLLHEKKSGSPVAKDAVSSNDPHGRDGPARRMADAGERADASSASSASGTSSLGFKVPPREEGWGIDAPAGRQELLAQVKVIPDATLQIGSATLTTDQAAKAAEPRSDPLTPEEAAQGAAR